MTNQWVVMKDDGLGRDPYYVQHAGTKEIARMWDGADFRTDSKERAEFETTLRNGAALTINVDLVSPGVALFSPAYKRGREILELWGRSGKDGNRYYAESTDLEIAEYRSDRYAAIRALAKRLGYPKVEFHVEKEY